MSKFSALGFQQTAIDELQKSFKKLWSNPARQLPLVFKSPTGSGKTFMVATFINSLNNLADWDADKCFIWITFNDSIAMQSRDKFKIYFENNLKNELLTVDDINRGKLNKNDILFVNWQKLVKDDASTRKLKLRRKGNEEQLKETGVYFEDFIEATHATKREIVMIVDESHIGAATELAGELLDIINPKIILNVSATPKTEPSASDVKHNRKGFVEVERQDVIDAGLIKEKIVTQTKEDIEKYKGKDQDEILLELAITKRNELKKQYEDLGKKVNPLVLIQLPNDDKDRTATKEKTKEEIVTAYLKNQGIKSEEIALWFDGKTVNMDDIAYNENPVNFMLFKMAAGTGWDCPRASVLVMYREIKSDTFNIQTVGRILRMAEPEYFTDYKNNPDLRTGYLFTNYDRNEIHKKESSDAQTKTLHTKVQDRFEDDVAEFNALALETVYFSRVDYGDLGEAHIFQKHFIHSMDEQFGIDKNHLSEQAVEILRKNNVDVEPKVTNKIIVDAKYEDFDNLFTELREKGTDIDLSISQNDLEKTYNYLCYKTLNEITEEDAKYNNVSRAWATLKSSLNQWFERFLKHDKRRFYMIIVNDIAKEGNSVLLPKIIKTLKDYKPILKGKLELKNKKMREEAKENPLLFSISLSESYPADYEGKDYNKCVYEKYYTLKDYTGKINEEKFIEFLEKSNSVDWWFKNGDFGKNFFAIPYKVKGDERLFYPDWFIKFKTGKYGIYDTKGGMTAELEETSEKAVVLHKKIIELNSKHGNIFKGGILVKENESTWYVNDSGAYEYTQGKLNSDWKNLEL